MMHRFPFSIQKNIMTAEVLQMQNHPEKQITEHSAKRVALLLGFFQKKSRMAIQRKSHFSRKATQIPLLEKGNSVRSRAVSWANGNGRHFRCGCDERVTIYIEYEHLFHTFFWRWSAHQVLYVSWREAWTYKYISVFTFDTRTKLTQSAIHASPQVRGTHRVLLFTARWISSFRALVLCSRFCTTNVDRQTKI